MTVGDIGNNQIEQISRSFQAVGESLKRNNWFGHTYLAIDSNNNVTTTWFKYSSGASFESITTLVEKIMNKEDISDIDRGKILDGFAQIKDKFQAKQPSMLTQLAGQIFKNYFSKIQANKNLLLQRANDLINRSKNELLSSEKQNEFIHLLNKWKAFSGDHFDFQFIQNFNNSKKDMVYQWLKKLEASEQFKSQAKQPIANAACQILQALNSPIFQERFFALVSDDLAGCGDRAAMLFNNLFLEWKLSTLDANAPKVNQLNLMVSGSKTLTLRQALQTRISEKERELRQEVEKKFPTLSQKEQEEKWQIGESVEIYLYYETKLKKSLNLLTFMDTMSYSILGKSDWIDEQELVAEVEKEYIDALNHLPSFITLRDADADFIRRWQTAKTDIDKKTDQIEDQISDGSINDYDYKIAMEHLGKELDIKKNDVTREWLQETLKV